MYKPQPPKSSHTPVLSRPDSLSPLPLVLDTNIVLDLLVFADDNIPPLQQLLRTQQVHWLATQPMRTELERVLHYPKIAPRVDFHGHSTATVLAAFDAQCTLCEPAPRAPYVCKDADDQKFINLAWQERATLLSKDRAVLKMHRRLAHNGAAALTLAQFNSQRDQTTASQQPQ